MYESKLAYPELKVEGENPYYAKLLLSDYAGDNSEDTAIHQYFYQSLIASEKDLSAALMNISRVEMHHLSILGKIIKLLGGDPILATTEDECVTYWDASNVNYTLNVEDFLKFNIMKEKLAIENYERHIEEINDKYIKAILKRIIDDELLHIKIFYDFYKKIK